MASAFIEAFNSQLRQECLIASWFLSVAEARDRINAWKIEYNEDRTQPRKLDAERLCGPTETSPEGRMKPGPKTR